jgi:hypothetical protein
MAACLLLLYCYHASVNITLNCFNDSPLCRILGLVIKKPFSIFYTVFATPCNVIICVAHFFGVTFIFSPFVPRQEIDVGLLVKEIVH